MEELKLLIPPSITPSLCQRCGACCSAVVDGELVACRHLDTSDGFHCRIYATRPEVCRDYSCIRDGRIASTAVAARVLVAIAQETVNDTLARERPDARMRRASELPSQHSPLPITANASNRDRSSP